MLLRTLLPFLLLVALATPVAFGDDNASSLPNVFAGVLDSEEEPGSPLEFDDTDATGILTCHEWTTHSAAQGQAPAAAAPGTRPNNQALIRAPPFAVS